MLIGSPDEDVVEVFAEDGVSCPSMSYAWPRGDLIWEKESQVLVLAAFLYMLLPASCVRTLYVCAAQKTSHWERGPVIEQFVTFSPSDIVIDRRSLSNHKYASAQTVREDAKTSLEGMKSNKGKR